uniref:Uncharacterized protein n=1 Tax=Globisporangium ultimum (strain ATCC 200006 / CBS 805.95 / DAOM BR144) TaxID=431595 RepID=K3WAA5_GLOUD
MATSPVSKSATPTSELLDMLSSADIARLVNEAAQGRLKSAKALRDALMLPVTIQKVQQILSSDDFQAKVKLAAAKATTASINADSASEDEDDATAAPDGIPRNAKANDKKRRPRTATVTKVDGTQLTISEGQVFKDRALVKNIVREFAAAQGKSVLIHRKTNGGNNFMYPNTV